ncbi:GEM-like protein 7 [Cynara cardunculus var. scolymus]|uniref:GEM-like protein 7 n=1 Tax=Cynara cardunculus var. scolymus TaxID=59895 RepID=UPI000D6237E8|nr:GEM-like protein 7 [Cynara cardunculus var. scolymus]
MDTRLSSSVMGIPMTSTRGLLLSKPYEPHYPLSNSKINVNSLERKGSFAVAIKDRASLVPKLMELVKQKLNYGTKILPLGREAKLFRKSFSTRDGEKLLHASRCHIYTTVGAIAGILFMSSERVGFHSDRSLQTYSTAGELLKFQYKVSIPLEKIKRVGESMNTKRPSNKYVELVTMDDFNFWFMGFSDYRKTLRHLHRTIGPDCLSN